MIPRTALLVCLGALALSSIACGPKVEPVFASAGSEPEYAERYTADLQASTTSLVEKRAQAKLSYEAFAGYPNQLSKPPWPLVRDIVERADAAGRSRAFVERVHESESASAFFTAEKDELGRKVAGSVSYTAKKKGCDADLGGTAVGAMREAVDKQLDEHARKGNDAQQLIERRRAQLGKENAATMEKLAADVSRASYLVYVDLPERKAHIERMLDDAGRAKRTADTFLEDEKRYQAETKLAPADKRASDEHIEAMRKSQAGIDEAVSGARKTLAHIDDEILAARRDYEAARKALSKAIDAKEKEAER